MLLRKEKRGFQAKFISAPDDYLYLLAERDGATVPIDGALWIWPEFVSRGHVRRSFEITSIPERARLTLLCDNAFDVFINGREFSGEKHGDWFSLTDLDIKDALTVGVNHVALRLFGSSSLYKQISAISGGLIISYGDREERVLTDSSWECVAACNFYKKSEFEGWNTGAKAPKLRGLNVTPLHPRYKARSCYFKKSFSVTERVSSATLYATAEGLYEPTLNGALFDDAMFIPGSMEAVKEYQIFDLTDKLVIGENTLGFTLASGWLNSCSWGTFYCKKPSLLAELVIEYESGRRQVVKTDESFLLIASPLIDNDLQYGEKYDARAEKEMRCLCNYVYADEVERDFSLVSQSYPPVRIKAELTAVSIRELRRGVFIYDFKNNGAGRAKIILKNTAPGQVIKIRYSELLDDCGNPEIGAYQDVFFPDDNNEGAVAEYSVRNLDVYICRGGECEEYYPRFAYTGFRYVYIEGYDGADLDTVKMLLMHTDLDQNGDIKTSDSDIACIFDVVKRSYRSNIFTGPTDCPTREKNFWNGDIQGFAHTAMWYMDNKEFLTAWTKWGRKIEYDVYGWEDEEYILPLTLYKFYGDKSVIEDKYPTVLSLIAKRERQNGDSVFPESSYSPYRDHKAIENVPADYYGAVYFTYMYKCVAEMAKILGKEEDNLRFTAKFEELKARFNKLYYVESKADYTPECQGGVVFPLAFGLAPEKDRARIAETLHKYVQKADHHFTTGFMTSERILGLLCDFGYENDALKIIKSRTYPSILDMISSGATTTTENWTGHRETFKYDSMNHYAFGGFSRWFFEHLGGIKILAPGFEKIRLEPCMFRELSNFAVSYKTDKGTLKSSWSYDKARESFIYKCSIPKGISATLKLPDREDIEVTGDLSFEIRN